MNIVSEVVTVTPEMANLWLQKNVDNRQINRAALDRYKADMKAGKWMLTGEAITFSLSGRLSNGQHRLLACAQSGCSFQTLVVRGVPEESFAATDTGRNRKASDVLFMIGEKNVIALAACARAHRALRMYPNVPSYVHAFPNDDVLHEHRAYPSIEKVVVRSRSNKLNLLTSHELGVFALASTKGWADEVDEALRAFFSGEHKNDNEPMWVLRERLLETSSRGSSSRLPRDVRQSFTIKALNAFLLGKPLKILRQMSMESFPMIVDPHEQK